MSERHDAGVSAGLVCYGLFGLWQASCDDVLGCHSSSLGSAARRSGFVIR